MVSVSRGDDVLLERAHGHAPSGAVALEGCDAGVSFRSVHEPATGLTHTVMAATTDGAWPLSRRLAELEGR